MKIKKFILYVLTIGLLFLTNACTSKNSTVETQAKLNIVTNIFPTYDWVREITKSGDVNISYLTDTGVSLHNYEPSAEDIKKIKESDLFVYLGSHSDKWADKILSENPDLKVIKLMDVLEDNILDEEVKEGMEDHHDHDHDHEHDDHDHKDADHDHNHDEEDKHDENDEHNHDHNHEDEHSHEHHHDHHHEDEHVWLSIKNAQLICKAIEEKLSEIDSKNKNLYEKNLNNYLQKLTNLDNEYIKEINSSKDRTLIFADRFPFRYLTEDYDLDYYAAFTGCSADAEASFDTIVFLVKKLDELNINSVFTLTDSDGKIARTIIENSKKDIKILKLNSMESVNKDQAQEATYIDYMKDNLKSIIQGLE